MGGDAGRSGKVVDQVSAGVQVGENSACLPQERSQNSTRSFGENFDNLHSVTEIADTHQHPQATVLFTFQPSPCLALDPKIPIGQAGIRLRIREGWIHGLQGHTAQPHT